MFAELKQTSEFFFFHHAGRGRIRMKRHLASQQRTFSRLSTGWCWLSCFRCCIAGLHHSVVLKSAFCDSEFDHEWFSSEEEMLKFMGLMNSSWVLDGHDIVTAFNLSGFQNIVDVGGKKSLVGICMCVCMICRLKSSPCVITLCSHNDIWITPRLHRGSGPWDGEGISVLLRHRVRPPSGRRNSSETFLSGERRCRVSSRWDSVSFAHQKKTHWLV